MNPTTRKLPATKSTGVRMYQVSLALAPGILAMAWQYGLGVIWNMLWLIVLCSMVALSKNGVKWLRKKKHTFSVTLFSGVMSD